MEEFVPPKKKLLDEDKDATKKNEALFSLYITQTLMASAPFGPVFVGH